MLKINYKQQINDGINWKCGVVSLEMIFNYYGIHSDSDDIWENIKAKNPNSLGQYYAHTHKMARYAIDHGLNATVFRARKDTWLYILNQINEMDIPAILLIRAKRAAHFVVYTGIKNKMYYYVDPNTDREFCYFKRENMEDVWAPQPEFGVTGYTFLVFSEQVNEVIKCQKCTGDVPVVFKSLLTLSEGIACPHCGSAAFMVP